MGVRGGGGHAAKRSVTQQHTGREDTLVRGLVAKESLRNTGDARLASAERRCGHGGSRVRALALALVAPRFDEFTGVRGAFDDSNQLA